MNRQPIVLANWSMGTTVAAHLAFLRAFQELAGETPSQVQVVLCPRYTAHLGMAQALGRGGPTQLGEPTVSAQSGGAHTGQISEKFVADAGGRWAQLCHSEHRRHLREADQSVNRHAYQALKACLNPILFVGERRGVAAKGVAAAVGQQLSFSLGLHR